MKIPEMSSFDVSRTGLQAERFRINVIANNIANAMTTKTADGEPFRRQLVVFRGKQAQPGSSAIQGVEVNRVVDDQSPFRQVYQPGHPEANPEGYVMFPNVEVPMEMVDLITATRAYEANVAAIDSTKKMLTSSLQIIEA